MIKFEREIGFTESNGVVNADIGDCTDLATDFGQFALGRYFDNAYALFSIRDGVKRLLDESTENSFSGVLKLWNGRAIVQRLKHNSRNAVYFSIECTRLVNDRFLVKIER